MSSATIEAPVRTSTSPMLQLTNLSVSYDGKPAVQNVTFSISSGERYAIIGESGSGKTTVCMAISGFLPRNATISSEERSFQGVPIGATKQKTLIAPRVPGVVTIFQDAMSSLDPVSTIGKQFTAVLNGVRKTSAKEAIERSEGILRSVGLHDVDRIWKSSAARLSGGMRQRVMIALALAAEPQLVIADEPTSALDASLARETMEVLSELTATTGAALLIVSHDIALCARYVDHLVVMRNGRVVESMTPQELAAQAPGSSYGRGLLDSIPTLSNWDVERLRTIDANQEFTA
ncbi:ABC transporter ATP-binding protein [Frondihabitans australicus]|uniref:Peptide/nickel transport system ATP-binding protein n=1 Tax=Frondihabitans australicus TaxID=386892 RepID=A0A495IBR0_9MICO|nr:ABC transporter ATP-binding protein [Frondihabitans australicus]RKR73437.1 peptide/nickel transport system ATP-binding protein [Frondihabitans australicus]